MLERIILSVVFVVAVLTFYAARKIARDNDRLFMIIKIACGIVAFACVIVAVVIT